MAACLSGADPIAMVSPSWTDSLALSFGGVAHPCEGGAGPGDAVLRTFSDLHSGMADVIGVNTPVLTCISSNVSACSAGCRPATPRACALPGSSSDETPVLARRQLRGAPPWYDILGAVFRALQQTTDPGFRRCPPLLGFSTCAPFQTPPRWGTSPFDEATARVSIALGGWDVAYLDLQRTLQLSPGVVDPSQPAWGDADVAAMQLYVAAAGSRQTNNGGRTQIFSPPLVAVTVCAAWASWLAGCRHPALMVLRSSPSSPSACVYATAVNGTVFSDDLGAFIAPVNSSLALQPFEGASCLANGTRATRALLGTVLVNATNTSAVQLAAEMEAAGLPANASASVALTFLRPAWQLLDPTTGHVALVWPDTAGRAGAAAGGVALSAPEALSLTRRRQAFPPDVAHLRAVTGAEAASALAFGAGAQPAASNRTPGAAASANGWAPLDAFTDAGLAQIAARIAVQQVLLLRRTALVLQAASGLRCRVVGPAPGASAAWMCSALVNSTDNVAGFTYSDAVTFLVALDPPGLSSSPLPVGAGAGLGAAVPPGFLSAAQAAAAVAAAELVAWVPAAQPWPFGGLAGHSALPDVPELLGSPLSPEFRAFIDRTLIAMASVLGLLLMALGLDWFYASAPARRGQYIRIAPAQGGGAHTD